MAGEYLFRLYGVHDWPTHRRPNERAGSSLATAKESIGPIWMKTSASPACCWETVRLEADAIRGLPESRFRVTGFAGDDLSCPEGA